MFKNNFQNLVQLQLSKFSVIFKLSVEKMSTVSAIKATQAKLSPVSKDPNQASKDPTSASPTTGKTTQPVDPVDLNGSTESTVPEFSDLQDMVAKETNRMISEIRRLKTSFFSNRVTPERKEKMFKKIAKRCFNDIDCLNDLNYLEPRQTELRLYVDTKLDAVRKDIEKLKKLATDLQSINECTENHVCRDMKNFFI